MGTSLWELQGSPFVPATDALTVVHGGPVTLEWAHFDTTAHPEALQTNRPSSPRPCGEYRSAPSWVFTSTTMPHVGHFLRPAFVLFSVVLRIRPIYTSVASLATTISAPPNYQPRVIVDTYASPQPPTPAVRRIGRSSRLD